MRARFHNNQSGIALGPILFIIAILAILGAVLAAGSGSFNASTGAESAKAMAQTITNQCAAYQDALNLVFGNGCDVTQIDWSPANGGGYPSGTGAWVHGDYSTGGTGHTGNGQCAFFDPRGGGMTFKPIPNAALYTPTSGQYTTYEGGAVDAILTAYAGYPVLYAYYCVMGTGTCSSTYAASTNPSSSLYYRVNYINYATCQQINKILGISWDPSAVEFVDNALQQNIFNSYSFHDGAGVVGQVGFWSQRGTAEGCAGDYMSNNGAFNKTGPFVFICSLTIR